ncbi:MAG: radical SAM protein, partial [Myxococcota bacterium]|nr:radical SAM protein [Myxococcota bacterium]
MRVYGPVPSRRFGLSLGIDLLPRKTCPFDCLYCQVGPTSALIAEPAEFFPVDEVMADVEAALAQGPRPDVITLAGSGEPTLYAPLEELLTRLRRLKAAPILLITNSSLLWRKDVARAVRIADILAPSLDAGDEETYLRLNRPHPTCGFERMYAGLAEVTLDHPGEIRLEVMLVRGVNDSPKSLGAIATRLAGLWFDVLEINTPVRPPMPERGALPCDEEALERALLLFGPKARAIGAFARKTAQEPSAPRRFTDDDKNVREMLARRPCTAEDISASLSLPPEHVQDVLRRLESAGFVEPQATESVTY